MTDQEDGAGDNSVLSVNGEQDQSDAPLVFQCAGCNTVVGDSLSWTCANKDLRTVSLKCKEL